MKETILGNNILQIMNDEMVPQFKTTPGNWTAVCLHFVYNAALEELKQSEKPPSEKSQHDETLREFGSKRPSVHDKCLQAYCQGEPKPEKPKNLTQENKEKPESNFAIVGAHPKMPFQSLAETVTLTPGMLERFDFDVEEKY